MDLNKHKMMFDESIVSRRRGLIRTPDTKYKHKYSDDTINAMDLDLSITVAPGEMRRILEGTNLTNESLRMFDYSVQKLEQDQSTINDDFNVKGKTDSLYTQFLEVLQSHQNDAEAFDKIEFLIQICSDIFDEVTKETRQGREKSKISEYIWLQRERNTWKLLQCLYKDRIIESKSMMEYDSLSIKGSEKEIVNQLYSTNANLREYQLIVDWLESCAHEQSTAQVGHFTDQTVAWENTLFQLKNPNEAVFGTGRDIVKSLDPDAPIREKKFLHDLDMEDQARLSKHIFAEIRQGRIEDAQMLCEHCGQPWRAAILEGWRLHEDPNYEAGNTSIKSPIEGNPKRDIWKKCAWMMADSKKFDEYTRAIAGVFCGHLESLLGPLNDSWDDLLWAYLKVQIDIRVESEIRSSCMKNYLPMPDKFWNAKMTLEQIFDALSDQRNVIVSNASKNPINVIQKYLILDDISELMRHIQIWMDERKLLPQMLRFLCHIVLFMRQVGKAVHEEIGDRIIKEYVECLIGKGDSQLVAFYTAALPGEMQVTLYSQYLETIKITAARSLALEEALAVGLDVETITCYTVETIRNRECPEIGAKPLQTTISEFDDYKILALEWLTFYPQQKGELLWQANAMIRSFLAENKIECVRKAFKIIPPESINEIILVYGTKENLPCKEECSIKEYLCHQTYLAAIDGYNDWTHLYHNRPKEPQLTKNNNTTFTERIASDIKEQTYRAEVERWNMSLMEQTRTTRDLLFNILLFPDKGWLIDPDTSNDGNGVEIQEWQNRLIQMDNLRKLCIPEIVLLLHKVLDLSGEYKDCVKLVDELASEQRQLYKVYSKHKLAEILSQIAKSSLSLLNQKYDPWGYVATI